MVIFKVAHVETGKNIAMSEKPGRLPECTNIMPLAIKRFCYGIF
jgi:hypothetical protein